MNCPNSKVATESRGRGCKRDPLDFQAAAKQTGPESACCAQPCLYMERLAPHVVTHAMLISLSVDEKDHFTKNAGCLHKRRS